MNISVRRASPWLAAFTLACLGVCPPAQATDASALDKLTPSGATREASKDGSIPAWEGAVPPLPGYEWGKLRRDHWKYKDDKPLFTIDASNVDQYADRLSAGQVAMLKQRKDYRMDVYPTRRTCGVPDFVAANTRKNVGTARLSEDGWSLKEATVPGYPFPLPDNGLQAMWNAKMRYRGVGIDYKATITAVSPRRGSTEWIRADSEQTLFIPSGAKGSTALSSLPPVEFFVYFAYTAPAALAGQALAVSQFINQAENETFYYFPGQRRVRRMPTYSHDSPQIGMENQYTLDEPNVFNGALDRFDWKLVGKREMLVPYNAFGAYDFKAKFEDVARPDFIAPSHRRYELHRVWVVEATVKAGMRHSAPKRTVYLDEDSWAPVMMDDFDGQGKLAKLREGFPVPVFETGSCDVMAMVQYNVQEGRYVFDTHAVGVGKDARWVTEPNGPRFKPGFYTADNLRAISER
ncbi:MAG: DUF1329 domain-containing protein [Aquincola sp.]|uniref:DUF1329 domain-containing protein n=1 Tax=uncultured Aquincola sp. TaxID=886556 RepID=UPI0032B26E04|nr:DUF1329 domain-containing protein [Aquincola sp.]|tara:strand:- start:5103 stop:6491 length:1389 start_codon:yes stop_codon:yes gene_type:complete